MKQKGRNIVFIVLLGMLGSVQPESGWTGEITGVPGSPSATTTIDGKQLPPPPDKHFGGKIERSSLDSTPYWPPRKLKAAMHANPASE